MLGRHERIIVVADEIYEHINYVGRHASMAEFDDIRDRVLQELDEAKEEDYPGMLDGTVFGVFAFTYNATPYEDFIG